MKLEVLKQVLYQILIRVADKFFFSFLVLLLAMYREDLITLTICSLSFLRKLILCFFFNVRKFQRLMLV